MSASGYAPERGGCLTAWLVVVMLANAGLAFYYLTSVDTFTNLPGLNISPAAIMFLALLGAVNVAAAVGIWMWKKWGFYLFGGSAAVATVVNLLSGIPIFNALTGLIGIAILWWLIRDKWQYMS
jgi:hypothetical protein